MLTARFYGAALRPPAPLPPGQLRHPAQDHPAWAALRQWCLAGSGPGTRPFWSPAAAPAIEQRCTVAVLAGGEPEAATALAHALCLERDGSLQLQACRSAGARLRLRLAAKLHDTLWWRERQPADAWDSGTIIATPQGLQALARFTPRRATLLVADDLPAGALLTVMADLHARQSQLAQPLRLLVLKPSGLPERLPMPVTTIWLGQQAA